MGEGAEDKGTHLMSPRRLREDKGTHLMSPRRLRIFHIYNGPPSCLPAMPVGWLSTPNFAVCVAEFRDLRLWSDPMVFSAVENLARPPRKIMGRIRAERAFQPKHTGVENRGNTPSMDF